MYSGSADKANLGQFLDEEIYSEFRQTLFKIYPNENNKTIECILARMQKEKFHRKYHKVDDKNLNDEMVKFLDTAHLGCKNIIKFYDNEYQKLKNKISKDYKNETQAVIDCVTQKMREDKFYKNADKFESIKIFEDNIYKNCTAIESSNNNGITQKANFVLMIILSTILCSFS